MKLSAVSYNQPSLSTWTVTSHPETTFAVIIIWTNNIQIPFKLGEEEDVEKAFLSFHHAHHSVSGYGTIIRVGLATPQWLIQSLGLQVHNSDIFSAGGKQQLPQGSWMVLKIIVYADYMQVSETLTSPSTNETLGQKRSNNKLPKHMLVWGAGLFLWRTSCFAAYDSTALVGGDLRSGCALSWVLWVAPWLVRSHITAFDLCLTMHQVAR